MEKICGRCAKNIICKTEDIGNCQCSTVQLSTATKHFLGETFYACLCAFCLNEINQLVLSNPKREPVHAGDFVEGIHFYKADGFFVFTETFHYLKGKCCRNQCRHCAYGYSK